MQGIPEIALKWCRAGHRTAMATVVETWGSAPRRVGAQLAIRDDGAMEGSVSGGCVEGAVVTEALDVLAASAPKMLEFGVTDADAFAVGLACGGRIRVWVEPLGQSWPEGMLEELVSARGQRRPVAYVVNTRTGARRLDYLGHDRAFRMDRSGFAEDGDTFVGIHNPPLRLVVVGAVHIAQHLVAMARDAGFDPYVIDPRESFAAAARFPDTVLNSDWPDEAVAAIGLDRRTALCLLTHDPKLDDPALHAALKSRAFYIGALSSTRTQAARMERMARAGYTKPDLARIQGPIGLPIGAATPAEIAVSILAQIISVLRSGT